MVGASEYAPSTPSIELSGRTRVRYPGMLEMQHMLLAWQPRYSRCIGIHVRLAYILDYSFRTRRTLLRWRVLEKPISCNSQQVAMNIQNSNTNQHGPRFARGSPR